MRRSLAGTLRPARLAAVSLLLLGGCDDPAETVKQVVEAKGDCSEDSLRVSSETCVRMFERYAGMVTEGVHTYIGGMKAMDQAIRRLPPANFDTVGLGRAITYRPDSVSADSTTPLFSPTSRVPRVYAAPARQEEEEEALDERYGPGGYEEEEQYAPGGYDPREREPVYDYPRSRQPSPAAAPPPAPRPGVLLPPGSRLNRPWLGDEDPEEEEERTR